MFVFNIWIFYYYLYIIWPNRRGEDWSWNPICNTSGFFLVFFLFYISPKMKIEMEEASRESFWYFQMIWLFCVSYKNCVCVLLKSLESHHKTVSNTQLFSRNVMIHMSVYSEHRNILHPLTRRQFGNLSKN